MSLKKKESQLSHRKPPSFGVVDLFCGVGGLSLGLKRSGMTILSGIDIDTACQVPFERNVGSRFLAEDVSNLSGKTLTQMFSCVDVRILAACAPCQPFSGYTTKRRNSDDRWRLLLDVSRIVDEVRPDLVTVENVPRLAKMPLWLKFTRELTDKGYHCSWTIVDSSSYGVPQRRMRLVMVASLLGPIDIADLPVRPRITVRAAIGHLPPIEAGAKNVEDTLHVARALTGKNLRRIRISRPSGTWKEWPKDLRAKCHLRKTGKTYPSVYGRMSWDEPSPTITTQCYGFGNGRFGHPVQDRAITLREAAILQSFPSDFVFTDDQEPVVFRTIGKLIGNAVPPELAYSVGQLMINHATPLSERSRNNSLSR